MGLKLITFSRLTKVFFFGLGFTFPLFAFSATSNDSTSGGSSTEFPGSVSPYIRSAPKSLSDQNLLASAYPDEAQLVCGTEECIFGLTRGLVVGGDLFGMLISPMHKFYNPNWNSGTTTLIDVFGGFQILNNVYSKSYMNAQIGYRHIQLNDGGNGIKSQGLTTRVNYSQKITSIYTQGLEFSAYLNLGNVSLDHPDKLSKNSPDHHSFSDAADYFYNNSQSYPTYKVFMPAYLELINWSPKQTTLPMPIHGYVEFAPFYIQNNFNYSSNNNSIHSTEQDFGARIAAVASYESSAEKAKSGRYALKSSLGFDLSSNSMNTTNSSSVSLDLPKRSFIAPYFELTGSWQF